MKSKDPAPDSGNPGPPALDPAVLLAGPRGRRLCLEIATLAATAAEAAGGSEFDGSGFRTARFHAAYNPGGGTSAVLFGPGADQPAPAPTAAEVAALLEDVPLPTLSDAMLLDALTETVNTARYWQEPDGDDNLAATPQMRRALHRFARQLADSPLTDWWTAPMDPAAQWSTAFVADPPRPSVAKKNAGNSLAQWRLDVMLEEAGAVRDRPSDPTANWGGEWWSRPPRDLPTSTCMMTGPDARELGPVGLWLVEDGFGEDEAVLTALQPPTGARIHQINSPADWAWLCRADALDVTAARRQDWYRTTGRNGPWLMPDWGLLQETYDAVHLTVGGYLATAGREIPVDETFSSVLAGWDPDATYWLRDVPADVATRQTWLRDQSQEQESPVWAPRGDRIQCRTQPARSQWSFNVADYRVSEVTTVLGHGGELWRRASNDVLRWKVKTRSGFSVDAPGPVVEGQRATVTASLLGIKVVEPVEVVAVVDTPNRVGFAYRTLPGHPVSGEEAFIVHRDGDGVQLTIRSLTRAAPQQPWRSLFPSLLAVQKLVRQRYLRALR